MSHAIFFSDIEGSTKLLQDLGPAYTELIAAHHGLMRAIFAAHGGQECGNEGDSFFVVFDDAVRAARAATDAQLALAANPWPDGKQVRVRMGLHVGEVIAVGDTHVGLAIHEAARIMSAAHGGQVLASEMFTAGLPPEGWSELGPHVLKDIPAPITLFQLVGPGLATDFPPPRTLRRNRMDLPAPASPFIGRDGEVAEVAGLLGHHRLLTLTGAGGAGKSRLAIHVAAGAEDAFADGVLWVDLIPASDEASVAKQFATAVGSPDDDLDGAVLTIGKGSVLLVVDNCEHVIDAVAECVEIVLARCPGASVLATSREPIGLAGEVSWRIPSMSSDEAFELFRQRTVSTEAGRVLSRDDEAVARRICERLDGIPLAIELAAARLISLGLRDLEDRLDQRFSVLTGGRRGGLARQRTLQATVDWSYDLLGADEQRLLRGLGMFVGGFDVGLAARVGASIGLGDVIDELDALVSKSLVVRGPEEGRFHLLETIRQYAIDRSVEAGEIVTARDAHLSAVRDRCDELSDASWNLVSSDDVYERIAVDHDNIRAAIDWSASSGQDELAVQILAATASFWVGKGHNDEGVRRALALAERVPEPSSELLAVLFMANICGTNANIALPDWLDAKIDAVSSEVALTDRYGFLVPMARAYAAASAQGEVTQRIDEVRSYVDMARSSGNAVALGATLQALSFVLLDAGRWDEARGAVVEAVGISDEAHIPIGMVRNRITLADVESRSGDLDAAWRHAADALVLAREHEDLALLVNILEALRVFAMQMDRPETALALALEAAEVARSGRLGYNAIGWSENSAAWTAVIVGEGAVAHRFAFACLERVRAEPTLFDPKISPLLHTAGDAALAVGDLRTAWAMYDESLTRAVEDETEWMVWWCMLSVVSMPDGLDTDLAGAVVASMPDRFRGNLMPPEQRYIDRLIDGVVPTDVLETAEVVARVRAVTSAKARGS